MLRQIFAAACLLSATAGAAQEDPSMAAYQKSIALASPPQLEERYGEDAIRQGELRLPKGKGPFPVAVMIHGGCWLSSFGNYKGFGAFSDALTKRGIATWNIGYRRLGDTGAGWPGTFQDVAAGVDHLKSLAKRNPLDLKRVTLVGHSAGAHLALWAASRGKLGREWKPKIRPMSVVAIDGPPALAPYVGIDEEQCGGPVITQLMGGKPADRATEYRLASPADHLPLGVKQMIVPATFTPFLKPYIETARQSGDTVEDLQADRFHFDVITPGSKNGERVIDFIASRAFAKPSKQSSR